VIYGYQLGNVIIYICVILAAKMMITCYLSGTLFLSPRS